MMDWAMKQLIIWIGIGSVAFVLISNQVTSDSVSSESHDVQRKVNAWAGNPEPSGYARKMTIQASADGHFRVVADVDGHSVDFLIDTGATGIAIAADVADRIGWRLSDRDYTMASHTAGGIVRAAPITLDTLEIGELRVRNLDAHVVEKLKGISLLGMEFLGRLQRYEVRGDELTLYW